MGIEWGPDEGIMPWRDAVKLAKAKGDGWRLPTVAELVNEFDYDMGGPKDQGWEHNRYWSSAPSGNLYAWYVHMGEGYSNAYHRVYGSDVRLVREVKP